MTNKPRGVRARLFAPLNTEDLDVQARRRIGGRVRLFAPQLGYNGQGGNNPDQLTELGYREWLDTTVPGKPAVQTRVINFYNNQDWVTSDIDRLLEQQRVGWGANQKNDKPDENAGYFLSGAKHIRSGNFIWNRAVTDLEEGLAFGASATHRSLGQEDGLGGT